MSGARDTSCACESAFPLPIDNRPGQAAIAYRVGSFREFRAALLETRQGETELTLWRPTSGDLGLALVEWFAYLADILSFYNEQAANNAYLTTASEPGAVERLVRVLGYRPRPGIGAKGVLGAILAPTTTGGVSIPLGFAVQSKPNPPPPQVFELDSTKPLLVPAVGALPVHLEPPALEHGFAVTPEAGVLLKGLVTGLKPFDRLMMGTLGRPPAPDARMVVVSSVATEVAADGAKNTRVKFSEAFSLNSDPTAYALFRSTESMGRLAFGAAAGSNFPLASLARSLRVDDAVAFPGDPLVYRVGSYTETIDNMPNPSGPALPFVHSLIGVASLELPFDFGAITDPALSVMALRLAGGAPPDVSQAQSIDFGFRPVARLIREPVASPLFSSTGLALSPDESPRDDVVVTGASALLVDATGNGTLAEVTSSTGSPTIQLALDEPRNLKLPLSLLFALIPVSRGKTVANETLGSGDATQPGQVFSLRKFPLTYFPGPDVSFPTSTLQVWVNGVQWREVRSFYQQPADAQVFVTRETVEQKTEVVFGDGVNGARLPTGMENVVATYRYGSGRQAPAAGELTSILKPVPGLRSIQNPVAVSGGDDPEPRERIREFAPRSALTFGRAISAGDYQAIAAQAPAVTRARAYYAWDATRQRALVKVYVGDDEAARDSARRALDSARDRNQPLQVLTARELRIGVAMTLVVDPRWDSDAVSAAVADALLDAETGLFSAKRLGIGERVYESRVVLACLSVPGAVAVHDLRMGEAHIAIVDWFRRAPSYLVQVPPAPAVLDPGEGAFLTLARSHLSVSVEVADG